jgi:soluble lytic murein transglycosylase-like protein
MDSAAQKSGVSVQLLEAVVQQESGFRPCSVSPKGAMGLMQLMPATAEEMGATDPFDPDQNVEAGARLLKVLMDRYGGDLNRVLGAYNAGPKRVDDAGGVPAIPETIKYVEGILGKLKE